MGDHSEEAEVAPPLVTKEGQKEEPKRKVPAKQAQKMTGKKTGTVLTGEAMKEKQKQLKQTRDEHRTEMDGRYSFLFTAIANAAGVDASQVEDHLLIDEKWDSIGEFFKANGRRRLMFYYQDVSVESVTRGDNASIANLGQKRFLIATGASEPLTGQCFMFIRTIEKAISNANIANEVNFQSFDASGGKLLDALEKQISKIVLPILKGLEDWGSISKNNGHNAKIMDFLELIDKFIEALMSARANMDGQIQLEDQEAEIVDRMNSPTELQAAVNSSETMERLEAVLTKWAKQIEQVLSESEQMRREADDIGPSAELNYWKTRMARFNNLLEQMRSPRVKGVVLVLNYAKSRIIKHWKDLDSRITDAANEAKDNVKYLYTLDSFFGPLVKCTPATMIEHIPALINAIRMIYAISQHYNTSERMTSLFVKVTNQMITTCKNYIYEGVSKIWELERTVLLQRINDCKKLNEEYQRCFHKTKERLKANPSERQFEFSENYIFGKFDTFCRRLDKILDMISTIDSYSGILDVKLEGIDSFIVRYKANCDAVKKKNYDILDHRRSEFDNDYIDFKAAFENLESAIQGFMDSWFDRPLTVSREAEFFSRVKMFL